MAHFTIMGWHFFCLCFDNNWTITTLKHKNTKLGLTVLCAGWFTLPHLTATDGILLWSCRCQSTTIQPGVFSRMRRGERPSHRGGEKKKFTHKATPARCASHYKRSCCIFLGSYMLSFDTQRSHGVRDAPSHGNRPERVHEVQDRALTLKSIKQRAGIQPNGLHWATTSSQWFAPSIFFLVRRLFCRAFVFCTGRNGHSKLICMIGEQEHTVWSGKPDIYGWEIYPKMYERRKLLSTSSGE